MTTTVQVQDETLELLRKVKAETQSSSYDEAIRKIVVLQVQEKTLGGYLGARSPKRLLRGLRDERERF